MLKEKLIEIRKKTGLSRRDFANSVGCSEQHISQMELGKSRVSFKTLQRYCKQFNIEIDLNLRYLTEKGLKDSGLG
jgi:transcriptional regulator with XRE-family HTH domain